MFCDQCGTQTNDDARFCPACGARLNAKPVSKPQASAPPIQEAASPMTLPDAPGQDASQGSQTDTPPPTGGQIPHVKNYLVESILCTICCCIPFGIPGIVFAAQVDKFLRSGDVQKAKDASKKAKKWTLVAFILGIVSWAAVIGLSVSGVLAFREIADYQYWY